MVDNSLNINKGLRSRAFFETRRRGDWRPLPESAVQGQDCYFLVPLLEIRAGLSWDLQEDVPECSGREKWDRERRFLNLNVTLMIAAHSILLVKIHISLIWQSFMITFWFIPSWNLEFEYILATGYQVCYQIMRSFNKVEQCLIAVK